jgi:hypothetical protein
MEQSDMVDPGPTAAKRRIMARNNGRAGGLMDAAKRSPVG